MDLDYFMVDHNIIEYAKTFKKRDMQVFVDANHILDLINQKSICRYVFIISRYVICFNSTKQRFIAGLTKKIKYIALNLASQQPILICRLIFQVFKTLLQIW